MKRPTVPTPDHMGIKVHVLHSHICVNKTYASLPCVPLRVSLRFILFMEFDLSTLNCLIQALPATFGTECNIQFTTLN